LLNLVLMRHGEAESSAPTDAQRRLTGRGRDMVNAHCIRLKSKLLKSQLEISRIMTSPYVRAQQTAELAQAVLSEGGREVRVEIWDQVTPNGKNEIVAKQLSDLEDSSVLLVTHQPFISHFIAYLIGADSSRSVVMQTASIVMIQQEVVMPGAGSLEWVFPPIDSPVNW